MASPNGHVVVEEDESGIDQSLDEIMKDPSTRTDEICRDYQRGYCRRGERCFFQHIAPENPTFGVPDPDLTAAGVVATLGGRPLCRDYLRRHCKRGVDCPYFHVKGGERCRDFDRMQDCRRGFHCPFLHVSLQQPRYPSSPTSPSATASPPPVHPPVHHPSPPSVHSHPAPHSPNGPLPPLGGRGGYGAAGIPPPFYREPMRRYDPAQPPPMFPNGKPTPFPLIKTELCRDWSRYDGDCPRGIQCLYLHGHAGDVCRDFTKRGKCYRGDNCPFTHQVNDEQQPPQQQLQDQQQQQFENEF